MEDMPVPPGFTRLTSFTLQRVQKDTSVAVPVQSEKDAADNIDKLRKMLRDRPWVNYREVHAISDSEDEEKPNQNTVEILPKGVIRGCPDCEDCQKVIARWRPEGSCRPVLDEVPVFHPEEEEFKDPLKYIDRIRANAEPYGICRIVPPSSWKPPCLLTEKNLWEGSKFSTRVQQIDKLQNREAVKICQSRDTMGRKKKRKTLSTQGKDSDSVETDPAIDNQDERFGFHSGPDFTPQSFKKYADLFKEQYFQSEADRQKPIRTVDEIEGEYWRIVEKPTEIIEVLYGADLDTGSLGSGFPKAGANSGNSEYAQSGWNLNNIPNLPGSVLRFESSDIPGVKIPWLYFGMCLSSFCWHVEDHHLYSLNYMHMGAPKVWYGVPGKDAQKFEDVMKKHLPHLFEEQPDLLHNLITQLVPSILVREGVPVFRCVQKEGEFVLTLPRAYHSGFNCGFNCAEAVNIAPIDWLPCGQLAVKLYRQQRRTITLSHDKLLIAAAREAIRALWNIYFRRSSTPDDFEWKRHSGKDGILTRTFNERKEVEQLQRKHLGLTSHCKEMDAEFDATVKECVFCHYDLYLSAVGCSSCPDKYACLMHANEMCLCGWSTRNILFRYNDDDLHVILDALRGKWSSVHRWGCKDLGLSLQKEAATLVNKCINASEGMRDAKLTGTSTEQKNRLSSGQLSGAGEDSGTRETEAVPARMDVGLQEGPITSEMAQNSDRAINASQQMTDAMLTGSIIELQHGRMSGCGESSRTRKAEAVPTRNDAGMREGSNASSFTHNSDDRPAQPGDLPLFVEVGKSRKFTVEILEYGSIMPRELWSTRHAIFPKGFRSRVRYWSVLEPNAWCEYISEILDAGLASPLFMVSVEGNSSEVFIHVSPNRCWDLVVQNVNELNKRFYEANKRRGRPTNPHHVQRPGSIDGLEMFGLSVPAVLRALEVLDSEHVSTEYWRVKHQSGVESTSGVAPAEMHQQNPLQRRMAPDAAE